MGEPVAVLVVPAEGDPGGLLKAGRCGNVAPGAIGCRCGAWASGDHAHPFPITIDCVLAARALPLWWDGALVPEGWDRLHRVCWPLGDVDRDPGLAGVLDWTGDLAMLHPSKVSRVVLLDRVEGRLVERAP